ncbi:Arogenate dehydrogenase 1 [Spatholobus suberectus]|nr:Arogenate dehydrogenase 1 [Spatholobus suberectus]
MLIFRSGDVTKLNKDTSSQSDDNSKLKIAIIGFGNFGQFLAKTIVRHGHQVFAYSRSDYSRVAQELGVSYFSDADDLCGQHPERLKRSTLFVDVLSVKELPRNWFLQHLPPNFDVRCTHPVFGPDSAKNGWNDHNFVFDEVRVERDELRTSRRDQIIDIFKSEGCQLVEMPCAEHDQQIACSWITVYQAHYWKNFRKAEVEANGN